ncbi:MAG TPA: HEAT repeat domain-containing protein [Dokdonella sp.]|nr:HEAT repeat domain-containing protein [Dokdonella sp.]
MIKILNTLVFGLCLLATTPVLAMPDGDMAPNDKQLAELYWQGHESLKKSDWTGALERFRRLEASLRQKEPASADAAIYWQAYALMQAKRTTEARASLEKLLRDFPDSRWRKDAEGLMHQAEGGSNAAAVAGGDDDLAEIAVTGLMQAPPERALPILRKVLKGSHSIEVKKRALFVLSQLDEDVAIDTLNEVAKSAADPELRAEAIRMMGLCGEEKAIDGLRTIYASSKNPLDKRNIIQAWLIADRPKLVMQSARTETDEELRKQAIQALGAMDATAELRELFDSEKSVENRKAILQSLGVAGDTETLSRIAGSGQQPEEIRVQAIQAIGIADGKDSGATLSRIYASANAPAIREAALQGMLISGDSDSMLKLYRQATSKEEKQALLRMLTLTNSDATLDLIEAELDNGSKKP